MWLNLEKDIGERVAWLIKFIFVLIFLQVVMETKRQIIVPLDILGLYGKLVTIKVITLY